MKWKISIVFSLVLVLLAACTPSKQTPESVEGPNPELSAIDSLMWRQPDSALAVLQHFAASPKADSLDEYNGHYCQLLISELLYKNYYDQSNREELLHAVDYFDSIVADGTDIRKTDAHGLSIQKQNVFFDARTHYINGAGYYERGEVVNACAEYLKALEMMEEQFEEKALTGKKAVFMFYSYNRLLELFSAQFMMDPALTCGEKALAYCRKVPSLSKEIPNTYCHIGKQYDKKGEIDIARYYYEMAIEEMPDTNSPIYRDAVSMKALCDYQLGLGAEQSLNTMKQNLAYVKDERERVARFLVIGSVYSEEGIYDSALRYFEFAFKNETDATSKIRAAESLRVVYDSLGDKEKANEFMRYLTDHKESEGENKALVSKLEDLFKTYIIQKQEKEAEAKRETAIKKVLGVIIPIAAVLALIIIVLAKLRSKKLLKKQQEEAKRALEEAGRQHEQELIQQREEALAAERTHRIQQSALSNRLKRSNEELRELKDQIRQQTDSMNPKQEVQALSFNDEPICRLIMERVNNGQFKAQMDCMNYKDYALGKDDLVALREAANRHFNQFTIRLAKAYPALTQGDLDYCCLYLLGLSDADVSALMQRAYNTVNERNSKLRRVLGSENAISFTLQAIANESVSI